MWFRILAFILTPVLLLACAGCCEPDCEGKCCGDNGCGGICPNICPDNCKEPFLVCDRISCECKNWECYPDCSGKCCGSDNCCGTCPNTCPLGWHCNFDSCLCEQNTCSIDDDCEGIACCRDGLCSFPDCTGLECGPDPVCGQECGQCDGLGYCQDGICVNCICRTDAECGSGNMCCDGCVCTYRDCSDRECGLDTVCRWGCGGCSPGKICNDQGKCEDSSVYFETRCGPVGSPEDVTYTQWSSCGCAMPCQYFDNESTCCPANDSAWECLYCGLYRCEAVEGGVIQGMGSMYIKVHEVSGGNCIFRLFEECEAGVTYFDCSVPIPVEPWASLIDFSGCKFWDDLYTYCITVGGCSLIPDSPEPECTDADLEDSCLWSDFVECQ